MRNSLPIIPKYLNFFGDGKDGNLNTIEDVNFESVQDGDTVFKYFKNVYINEGHTVTVQNRCKGLVIYCLGDCIIRGTLSMTARGAYADGETFAPNNLNDLIQWNQHIDRTIGAEGGASSNQDWTRSSGGYWSTSSIHNGNAAVNGACGGGGGGRGGWWRGGGYNGMGRNGNSFSGGAGGGGIAWVSSDASGYSASFNGGPGANGRARNTNDNYANRVHGNGGAGNPHGEGYRSWNSAQYSYDPCDAEDGTGGLLILAVLGRLFISSTGIIESKGSNGGMYGQAGGGGSGGGTITILHNRGYTNNGSIIVDGGISGGGWAGGAGGIGSLRVEEIV